MIHRPPLKTIVLSGGQSAQFEIDGVFLPPAPDVPGVVYSCEVQFQKDETFAHQHPARLCEVCQPEWY